MRIDAEHLSALMIPLYVMLAGIAAARVLGALGLLLASKMIEWRLLAPAGFQRVTLRHRARVTCAAGSIGLRDRFTGAKKSRL